jgi:hypothetical protein
MAQANPQMQMMQRYMPLLFAVIYINIAAGVNIYFIISSLCRIGIQEAIFRSGALNKAAPAAEGVLPSRAGGGTAAPRRRTMMERLAEMLQQKEAQQRAREGLPPAGKDRPGKDDATSRPPPRPAPASNGTPKSPGKTPAKPAGTNSAKGNGRGPGAKAPSPNGAESNGSGDKKPTHPRSKTKRERKDR